MRKINGKNKILFFVFSLVILFIIGLMIFISFNVINSEAGSKYVVSSNTVLFDETTEKIDTSSGGFISKKWNGSYIYNADKDNFILGNTPVIYEKVSENITLLAKSYYISGTGDVKQMVNYKTNANARESGVYKLADRKYLIVSSNIHTEDKTISIKKYLILFIDKRGNASLLNDSVNLKTINPIKLLFDDFEFDVANELLNYKDQIVDLKLINGSTNEYVPYNSKDKNVNMITFVNSYNKLVNDFNKYTSNNTLNVGSNNFVSNTNNNIVINNTNLNNPNPNQNQNNNQNLNSATNRVPLNKMVSLRGAVSGPNYIDVSYVVTDPEDKYNAVYLLVVGRIGDEDVTQKIILDKYNTVQRVDNLSLASEYTISLGYIETKSYRGEITLIDEIEDVINIRTKKSGAKITVNKVANGYVYFTFKMNDMYAYDEGVINLYVDDELISGVAFDYDKAVTTGFSTRLKLEDGNVYALRAENLVFNTVPINDNIVVKFTY